MKDLNNGVFTNKADIELIKSKYQTNIFDLDQRAQIKLQLEFLDALVIATDQSFN